MDIGEGLCFGGCCENMKPRILYSARLSWKIEGDKKLPEQTKTKGIRKHQSSPRGKIERGPLSKESLKET